MRVRVRWPLMVCVGAAVAIGLFTRYTSGVSASKRWSLDNWQQNSDFSDIIASTDTSKAVSLIARERLKQYPLDEKALLETALLIEPGDSEGRRRALLQAARTRNPRNRKVLTAMLVEAQTGGDIGTILKEVDLYFRLNPKEGKKLLPAFAAIYTTQIGQKDILDALIKTPPWGLPFLEYMVDNSPAGTLKSLRDTIITFRDSILEDNPSDKIRRRVNNLVGKSSERFLQDGDFELSYAVWLEAWPDAAGGTDAAKPINVNPELRKIDAGRPYNWQLFQGRKGSAFFEPQGGIYLSFGGLGEALLAEQNFAWPADKSIALVVDGSHSYRERNGNFFMTITCFSDEGDTILAQIDWADKGLEAQSQFQSQTAEVHQPDGQTCSVGQMQIRARQGAVIDSITLFLKAIRLNVISKPPSAEDLP